ncbi:MAG: transposase [Dehalococcoidales bacterium]|nr:transposase [Dehalococcoidales bacterium]
MEESNQNSPSMMLYERNDKVVIEAFRRGEFDYLEGVGEISETDFFRDIVSKKILEKLAATYPSPSQKVEVPIWAYIAGDISLRFHGVNQFHAFPYVVRSGGMINAFGPEMGHKVTHPQTGDVTLSCKGFNKKNEYDRQTPVDQDYLRKTAKKTDAGLLMTWFNRDVTGIFKQHHAFDTEGLFVGDASYLFVPDNAQYDKSSRLLFDEHNHPVDSQKPLSSQEKRLYRWRRCYKMVSLLHINRKGDYFLYVAVKVVSGKEHEAPILYQMIEEFIQYHGKGIIKKLLLDRGFLDGPQIGRCKQEWGIDILMPVRRNMDIYRDIMGLVETGELDFKPWTEPSPPAKPVARHPEAIRKREESRQRTLAQRKGLIVAASKMTEPSPSPASIPITARTEVAVVAAVNTFSTCPIPLDVIVNRDISANGEKDYWMLISTAPVSDPGLGRQEYALRTTIEERHRQLKCYSDLENFSSRSFNLVVNQVVFILLTYSLMQWYLMRRDRRELNTQTRPRILDRLKPSLTMILIYYQNYVAFLSALEHQELVLTLKDEARKKILVKTQALRRSLAQQLYNPRPP